MIPLSDGAVARLQEAAVRPELPGGRYELLQAIGRGGMGTVYAARDRLLDREVAVKVSNAVAASSELDRRLRAETGVLARLEHPGIVPVHDAGVLEDGRLFYVMKLVRGETLAAARDGLGTEASRLGVFERIVETVAYAHANGVVHRDLKPSNVMIGRFGEVLVLDWGASGRFDGAADPSAPPVSAGTVPASATRSGTRLGTPAFMAPEQARGEPAGPASDIYALGGVLFWLLTGAEPPGRSDLLRHDLDALTPAPPRRLRAIVCRALQEDPPVRYASAQELAADLARYRAGAPVSAHREHLVERAGRWLYAYRAVILLVLAYLVMRTLFAFWVR